MLQAQLQKIIVPDLGYEMQVKSIEGLFQKRMTIRLHT